MSVTIRRARLDDYEAVGKLAALLSGISADRKVQFAVVLESAEWDLLVAEEESAVVGYAELMSCEDLYSGGLSGELRALVVLEGCRGRGVGRALLEEAIRLASAWGANHSYQHGNRQPSRTATVPESRCKVGGRAHGDAAMSVTIRRAKVEDYEAVNTLETALVDDHADRRAMFAAVLSHPDHALLVAAVDGVVAGVAQLLIYLDLPHGQPSAELLGLVVSESHRRRGVARALLEETLAIAHARGVGEFHINTEQDNHAARALYASIGAEVVGVQMEMDL